MPAIKNRNINDNVALDLLTIAFNALIVVFKVAIRVYRKGMLRLFPLETHSFDPQ
jgi:hypothetical protein